MCSRLANCFIRIKFVLNPSDMKPFIYLLVLAVATSLAACNSNYDPKHTLPPPIDISQLTKTVFVATLENPIENKKKRHLCTYTPVRMG